MSDRSTNIYFAKFENVVDYIYTNIANTKVESGIAVTDILDHCGTFANFLLKSVCKNTKSYNFVRDIKNLQPELFLESLSKKLNTFALSDNKPVDSQFKRFMTILTDVVNEHAPLKKLPEEKQDSHKNHGLRKVCSTQSKRKTDSTRNS